MSKLDINSKNDLSFSAASYLFVVLEYELLTHGQNALLRNVSTLWADCYHLFA